LASDVDLDVVAGLTQGLSGAELANVMNEATLLAARRKIPAATLALIEEAVERVHLGVSRAHILTAQERKVVAYHESGHALVGRALQGAPAPRKLSIVPRGATLGAAWHEDSVEEVVHSRSVLIERMAGMLGGRAAEELVFGEPSSGASDDLAKVGHLARWMVCELAMGTTLGQMTYTDDGGRSDGASHNGYSEDAAKAIDAEVRQLIDLAFEKAKTILTASRKQLDTVAEALAERETLTAEELDELAGPPSKVKVKVVAGDSIGTVAKVAKAAVLRGLGSVRPPAN